MHRTLTLIAGLVVATLLPLGCNRNQPTRNDEDHPKGHGHVHATEGPHHGHLIELGHEEYHAELTHDEDSNTVTIYLLDSKAKTAVPIEEKELTLNIILGEKPRQFKLTASPQDDDAAGKASRFTSSDEQLIKALESEEVSGRLNVTINGKSYSGTVEHHEHAGEDHEHHD